ncbi:MAG: DUF3011 domain-containing protein [Proteobacteria bacterium]|nr:DUF3011 domain-containing protein [Pseudomonadota bacterium]
MRSIALSFLTAMFALAVTTPVPGQAEQAAAPMARAPVNQPALKQAPAAQTRSAQSDCVLEANRRGFTVLDTSNFQQLRDGWSIDLRVRNQRGQVTNGSCFVATRTGDVNLYGFGWGYDDNGDDRMQFNCASVDMKYRECQLPVSGRAVLVKRLSDARCVEGQSWGQRGDRVWVANGCRARFEVTRTGWGGGTKVVDCNSDGGRYRECAIGSGYFGRLLRDNSNGRCRENSTWGTRNGVIWVTNGCRGRFEKVRGNSGGSAGSGRAQAEQACSNEVQRRGGRILQQDAAVAMSGGYRMQMRVRMPTGETRAVGCTYSSQSRQVRVEVLSGT